MRGLPTLRWTLGTWRLLGATILILYVAAGSVESASSGLTVDDAVEQFTFQKIIHAAHGLLTGHIDEYNQLQSYGDRYYGIGFDALAYPVQVALRPYLSRIAHTDDATALLLGARPIILLLFAMSIVVFYRCARLLINERSIAATISAVYATNPYLFGHAMINVRDSPFMSVYLLCTYLSLKLVKRRFDGAADCSWHMLKLGAATAALASVRLPGLMILVQYVFTFLVADRVGRDGRAPCVILSWKNIACFSAVLFPLVFLFFPAIWLNPIREIAAGLKFVGWYYQPGCTLTWGRCMAAYATPEYVFGWLIVKLPLLILASIALVPFALRKLWQKPFQRIAYLTLLFGSVYVLMVIIPLRAHLYDDTRQLLFMYPLLFLCGLVAISLTSRRVLLAAACLSVALSAWDQARLNPYQYVYFNEAARLFDVDRLFETDYWGLSAREHARLLEPDVRLLASHRCLYADPVWLYRPFLPPDVCVEPLESIVRQEKGDGLVIAITSSPNRITLPSNCELLSRVTRSLPLANRVLTLSAGYYCRTQ